MSSNTGISTVINSRGEVIDELAPLVDGMIVEDVCVSSNKTLYTTIGNLFVYLSILFVALVIALEVCFGIKKRKSEKSVSKV